MTSRGAAVTGDRLHQTANTRTEATDAIRTSVGVQSTIAAGTEPAAGRARDPIVDLRIQTLTRRERELLGLLANGWSNRRIANECLLSLHTVRTRMQNILVKLGVHSKLEAVAFAFEHGLVRPERSLAPNPEEIYRWHWSGVLSPHSTTSRGPG
jgi:DNA-binding NarL/FixJ family response regulator